MLTIERKVVKYISPELGIPVSHYVLIAHTGQKSQLLSFPNLFLYSTSRLSISTSSRYSSIISMFYRYLATEENFKEHDPSVYHAIVTDREIKRWQYSRQTARVAAQSLKPTTATIYEDLKILLKYFQWLNTSGYGTNINVETRTSVARFNRTKLLSYIQAKARTTIDAKNYRMLDKEARQKHRRTLITNSEIKTYLQCFIDPVYATLFNLALGTAMRPMDLCKFPFLGNGANSHIMPFSEMDKTPETFEYTVYNSKGNKTRTIVIHRDDLKALDESYIKPHLNERRRKYQERFGHECPLSILFLNKHGVPVTAAKIASRGNAAKTRALEIDENFRESINFYESRHWWPTMFLIRFFGEKILTESADVMWAAAGEVLRNQMGHEDLETTFEHYIDMARVVTLANKGRTTELLKHAHSGVHSFIEQLNRGEIALNE
ncbi:site-specific integrase [Pseudomonas putida]|uniref:site-specific integrase n=1 Tax=Pseudomonas TaxID=286 RepID=UPI000E0E032D|nr:MULTISPECIES: site-specific integrase [Pseudomonas]MBC3422210.1 site-specific integrase [Pseudomonas sp. RW3S2]WQE55673.1 site-specific integrase [Pseudomonas putida]HDS1004851.1 site-specific integrase [Pseudomonas putida]